MSEEQQNPPIERIRLPDISSLAWEHPADAMALNSLRQMPGFEIVARKVFGLIAERSLRAILLGSSVEVNNEQYPEINETYEDVLAILDAPQRYPLFLSQSSLVKPGTVGMENPIIVLSAGSASSMSDDQLRFKLGHEVAQILSGHILYNTMLDLMIQLSRIAFVNIASGMAYTAVMAALMEWDRKSELSADRAGLLVVQDPDKVRLALLRAAGGIKAGASIEAFREQARRYEEHSTAFDNITRTLALLKHNQPLPVERLKELDTWIESGAYDRILSGEYPRRSEEMYRPDRPWGIWQESATAYAEEMKKSSLREWLSGLRRRFRGENPAEE